ncbi:hypothetical protein NA57DRAFT_32685 [Rhizodiscina lignyota]|uniref:Folliculin-interacting protein N-terminal domain-containing protein n=1 Tax=Rhizodiscina lignyota TaxID=1504668 RepID=A0A9P4IKK9_9PEZI|nr:hypothetical protein NA57DRAFT_32685 [Rhizodiscina lignyota]
MLSSLLQSITPAKRGPQRHAQLDSQTEEAHTKSLLFPDAGQLSQPASLSDSLPGDFPLSGAGGTDCTLGDIDLESPRDVRILVAQNFTGAQNEIVLFDSWPILRPESPLVQRDPAPAERGLKASATAPPSRRSSVVSQDGGRRSPSSFGSGGAFQRNRLRNTSISTPLPFIDETAQARHRESEDMVKTALECMFENAQSSYKGTSNRIHIIPLEQKPNETVLSSPTFADGPASFGKVGGQRRSHLAKSYTPGDPPANTGSDGGRTPHTPVRDVRRRTVLISRTFSVPLVDGGEGVATPNETTPTPANPNPSGGFPFPKNANGRSGGWSFVDSVFGVDSMLSSSFNSDVDDRVDLIGQHWDIISRTLTALQYLAQEKILALLKPQVRAYRPQLQPGALTADEDMKKIAESAGRRIVRGIKLPRVRTGQGRWGIWREEAIWLGKWAGAREQSFFLENLMTAFLGQHTDWMRVFGPKWHRKRYKEQQNAKLNDDLTIPNRTIIITDNKMAARRLIFLLSAFLPSSHPSHEGTSSPGRPGTAVSLRGYSQSPPGMATIGRQESLRRTINRRGHASSSRTRLPSGRGGHRGESADERTLSGNDLSGDDGERSRRGSEARSILRAPITLSPEEDATLRKASATTTSTITPDTGVPAAHFAIQRTNSSTDLAGRALHRRPGSSGSLASANLVSALNRNSTGSSTESQPAGSRWGSLKSFWSMGTRRESGTDYSDILQSTDEGLGILSLNGARLVQSRSSSKLEQMVREVEIGSGRTSYDADRHQPPSMASEQQSPDLFDGSQGQSTPPSSAQPIPERAKVPESPFKMSVNEKDGIIDVEIPFLDFTGSPPSTQRSPYLPPHSSHSHHHHGGSGHHHSSSFASSTSNSPGHPHPPSDTTHPLNVAGWLTMFHPDFALQAVSPYANLMADIKDAMRAEPTPVCAALTPDTESGPTDKWVDVCRCLIADTREWKVKRLSLRRLVRLVPVLGQPAVTPGITPGAAPLGMASRGAAVAAAGRSRYGNPYEAYTHSKVDGAGPQLAMSEIHLKEEWKTEDVMDLDDVLVEAVEKVISSAAGSVGPVSLAGSRIPSATSSRSSSRRGRLEGDVAPLTSAIAAGDVPRETRDAVMGALEAIVRSVVTERQQAGEDVTMDDKKSVIRLSGENLRESTLKEGVKRWLTEVEQGTK